VGELFDLGIFGKKVVDGLVHIAIMLYIFGEGFVVTEKLGKNIIGLWTHRVSACVP
jgi:hypothetical protein